MLKTETFDSDVLMYVSRHCQELDESLEAKLRQSLHACF